MIQLFESHDGRKSFQGWLVPGTGLCICFCWNMHRIRLEESHNGTVASRVRSSCRYELGGLPADCDILSHGLTYALCDLRALLPRSAASPGPSQSSARGRCSARVWGE